MRSQCSQAVQKTTRQNAWTTKPILKMVNIQELGQKVALKCRHNRGFNFLALILNLVNVGN
jgi:hypothetical protein